MKKLLSIGFMATLCCMTTANAAINEKNLRSSQEIIDTAPDSAWHTVPQDRLLYMKLDKGTVIYELSPEFAPEHVAQIKMLAKHHFWDGLKIYRVQDNYVAQFGDPDEEHPIKKLPAEMKKLPMEFERSAKGLKFTALADKDIWADKVGFVDDFAVAIQGNKAWLPHCYGAVGAGRDNKPDSSTGTELYVTIGHAPRHLDRNITVVGRVLKGIEYLSALPRGGGDNGGYMGFYQDPNEYIDIKSVTLGSDLPQSEQQKIEVMRTDSPAFAELLNTRRHRKGDWFYRPIEHIDVCAVNIPIRNNSKK